TLDRSPTKIAQAIAALQNRTSSTPTQQNRPILCTSSLARTTPHASCAAPARASARNTLSGNSGAPEIKNGKWNVIHSAIRIIQPRTGGSPEDRRNRNRTSDPDPLQFRSRLEQPGKSPSCSRIGLLSGQGRTELCCAAVQVHSGPAEGLRPITGESIIGVVDD